MSINFGYTRYIVTKNAGIGKPAKNFANSLAVGGTNFFSAFSAPLFGDTTFSEPYDMDFDLFGSGNTVDFTAGFGLQSFSDQGIRDAFLGSGSASLGLGANDLYGTTANFS